MTRIRLYGVAFVAGKCTIAGRQLSEIRSSVTVIISVDWILARQGDKRWETRRLAASHSSGVRLIRGGDAATRWDSVRRFSPWEILVNRGNDEVRCVWPSRLSVQVMKRA